MANWFVFDDKEAMVAALKAAVTERLSGALAACGKASWAVSGGSTPAPLFEAMRGVDIDWKNVDVALVDERWVPFRHPRSNEAFVTKHLKAGMASQASITGMKTDHASARDGALDVNRRYETLALPFDSVLLGLGPDGHTASLFPDAEGLEQAFAPAAPTCVVLTAKKSDVTGDEVERMSLSAAAIAAAPHVAVMITGTAKRAVLEDALENAPELPVAKLHAIKKFDVYWAP